MSGRGKGRNNLKQKSEKKKKKEVGANSGKALKAKIMKVSIVS